MRLEITRQAKLTVRELLDRDGFLLVPGVFDAISARLVERAGFSAAYLTGSGVSISATGFPDNGLISFGEVIGRLDAVANSIEIPLIADGDTGYGDPINVYRTVHEYERLGAAAIQLEDQVMPKRCGHESGRTCVSTPEMVQKITAACDARKSSDFLVIARTDAIESEGLESAIQRGLHYADAGADVIFVEAMRTEKEIEEVGRRIPGLLMINMVEGGNTPILPARTLSDLGFSIAIYPNTVLRTICKQVGLVLDHLRIEGTSNGCFDQMMSHDQVWELFEKDAWATLAEEYASGKGVDVK